MNEPKREETIFAEALRLPPEERPAYLAQSTHGNAELRRRVESLLGSYGTGDFLEQAAAPELRKTLSVSVSVTERPGDTIGRYKLREQIGEGGCGIVYVAEQTEPVRRRLALKIIKLGMDTRSVIARFEAERQALALMDHPNIAKVFDAGATETGRPYFVMELVRGMKITDYCDEKKLSTRARLDLFIQVCQAIQHAHQKGIIHRDIKPSNILVTVNDGVPVPKVIDFGIAKATSGQQLTDKTIYTAFEQFIGTPAYMSPEQAVLTSLDIDTRSDIYALGVLLYELLTGKTPFDAKELLAVGLDEMRRTIREQEPPRPSTRLSTLPGQELSTTAQRRGLEAPKLVSELRGDLDWIVMKALEKDRARRYETANGLAADIHRHLNNEPIVARPTSALYRLQKTVHRNKLAFGAVAAVAIALIAGVIVSAWQAQRAKAERDSAKAVLEFLREKMLAAGRPEGQEGGLGKDVTLRKAIDAVEPQIADTFQDRPLVEAAIRETIGASYAYLGQSSLAIPQMERVLKLRRRHLGNEHPTTLQSMNHLGDTYAKSGNVEQGLELLEHALRLQKRKLGSQHPDTLETLNNIIGVYPLARKSEQAVVMGEEAVKMCKAAVGHESPITGRLMNNLSAAYLETYRPDKAIPLLEELLNLREVKLGPTHPDTLSAMNNLASALWLMGEAHRVTPICEETRKLQEAKLGLLHPHTITTTRLLAASYGEAGRIEQARAVLEQTLKVQEEKLGPTHPDTLESVGSLIKILDGATDDAETASWRQKLLMRMKQREGAPSALCANTLASLGRSLLRRQQWAEAEPVLRQCVTIWENLEPGAWAAFNARSMLGGALLGQRQLAAAQPLVIAGYEGLKRTAPDYNRDNELTDAMDRLVMLYEAARDQPEAATWKAEIERVRRVNDPGAIRRWLILSPISQTPGQSSGRRLDVEQLSNEAHLRPQPGEKVSIGKQDLVWRELLLRDYAINFNELLAAEMPRSVAYAVCYVQATTAKKGLVLKVGSDDLARVYLNGQKLYENLRPRALRLDEDTISGVELQAGLNTVVFKVLNQRGDWRGSLRFADKDDQPVHGINVALGAIEPNPNDVRHRRSQ